MRNGEWGMGNAEFGVWSSEWGVWSWVPNESGCVHANGEWGMGNGGSGDSMIDGFLLAQKANE
jgi:hypothetical protein